MYLLNVKCFLEKMLRYIINTCLIQLLYVFTESCSAFREKEWTALSLPKHSAPDDNWPQNSNIHVLLTQVLINLAYAYKIWWGGLGGELSEWDQWWWWWWRLGWHAGGVGVEWMGSETNFIHGCQYILNLIFIHPMLIKVLQWISKYLYKTTSSIYDEW